MFDDKISPAEPSEPVEPDAGEQRLEVWLRSAYQHAAFAANELDEVIYLTRRLQGLGVEFDVYPETLEQSALQVAALRDSAWRRIAELVSAEQAPAHGRLRRTRAASRR